MKTTDCHWEIDNIGKKTIELMFSKEDRFSPDDVAKACEGYEYLVAKVQTGNVESLFGLQSMGFKVIETQINISKRYNDFDFNDRLLKFFSDNLLFTEITDLKGMEHILSSISSNMFITDRVHLDPHLGPKLGLNRYRNWIRSEFQKGAFLFEFIYRGKNIGFCLFRKISDEIADVFLAGIYEQYQHLGYGILTASSIFLYCRAHNINIKKMLTSISSNNTPVVQIYNYLQFKVDSMSYVLVKHQ